MCDRYFCILSDSDTKLPQKCQYNSKLVFSYILSLVTKWCPLANFQKCDTISEHNVFANKSNDKIPNPGRNVMLYQTNQTLF